MNVWEQAKRWWERRFHVSQTPPAWVSRTYDMETASGLDVGPETALQATAVYACVRVLAETVASLPLLTYRRLPDGGKERVSEGVAQVLRATPNPEMSSFDWRETLMGHVLLWGNAYAEVVYNRAGAVIELWPLRPDRMAVKRVAGALVYEYRVGEGEVVTLSPARVLHIRGLGYDGVIGYSPVALARQAMGLGMATEEFGARFFGNGARPGGVLQHPGKLSETAYARLRDSFEKRHQGLSGAQRVAVLEEGMTYQQIGIPPEDAQFLETRKFQLDEIARIYRVPPHMVGDLDRATFSNVEQQSIDFVVHTIRPWLVRWEQALYRTLLTPAEQQTLFFEFLVDGLLRGDTQSRYAAYATGRQNGWLSANDIRALENMNPVEGGDMYLVPLNMVPATALSEQPVAESVPSARQRDPAEVEERRRTERREQYAGERQRLQRTWLPLYRELSTRVLKREAQDIAAGAKRFFGQRGQRDAQAFGTWLQEYYEQHTPWLIRQYEATARAYGGQTATSAQQEIGAAEEWSEALARWVADYLVTFAQRHNGISQNRVLDVATQGDDPQGAIEQEVGGWTEGRASEEGRFEAVRFGNAIAVAVYLMGAVKTLRWVTTGESTCPYCRSLAAKNVDINDFFLAVGEFNPAGAERPLTVKTPVGHAPAHSGCDCVTMAG